MRSGDTAEGWSPSEDIAGELLEWAFDRDDHPQHCLFGKRLAVIRERSARGPTYVVVELPDGSRSELLFPQRNSIATF
jgi:hypothetical protein